MMFCKHIHASLSVPALLILHLFEARLMQLLWHVVRLCSDKSGKDLNALKTGQKRKESI